MKSDHAALKDGRQAIEKGNYAAAVTELLPLARNGNASAQYWLAWMSHQGKGLPENKSAALAWARKAAVQGNADAEFLVGVLHAQGLGVARDDVEAARWFQRAGSRGNWSGQMKTGMCHMCGLGLPLDYLKAYMWFELAVAHSTGHDQVLNRHLRDVVAAMQLTPEQIAEAERLARNWKPQKPPGSNSPRPA
jgi:hypothetical protein